MPFMPRENTKKIVAYETENRLSPDTTSAGIFILDFPESRNIRNKFL